MWQKVAKFKGAEYFRKALYGMVEPVIYKEVAYACKSLVNCWEKEYAFPAGLNILQGPETVNSDKGSDNSRWGC